MLGIVLALALGSAGWMAHLVRPLTDPSRAYYGSDSRAHTLLIGAALGLVAAPLARHVGAACGGGRRSSAVPRSRWPSRPCSWSTAGTTGCTRAATSPSRCSAWPSINGAMAATTGPVARAPVVRPLPWIGRISYGLYLWHWLVDVWLTPQYQASFAVTLVVRLAITFALATASYYLVERPIRTAKWERLERPAWPP